MLLRVSPSKGVKHFGLRGKWSLRYVGPFEILERIGPVAHRLALPPKLDRVHNVFHISMLWKYLPDPSHVLDISAIELGGLQTDCRCPRRQWGSFRRRSYSFAGLFCRLIGRRLVRTLKCILVPVPLFAPFSPLIYYIFCYSVFRAGFYVKRLE